MATATATSNGDVLILKGEFDPEIFKDEISKRQTDFLKLKVRNYKSREQLLAWVVKLNLKRNWTPCEENPKLDFLSFYIKNTTIKVVNAYRTFI